MEADKTELGRDKNDLENLKPMKKKLSILAMVAIVTIAACAAIPNTTIIGNTSYVPYRVVKTNAVKLYTILGYNSGPAQFVMVFGTNNPSGAAPTNGQLGTFAFPVAASNYFSLDFSYYGANLDSISVANSTTATNLTLGSTNCSFQAIIAPQ